MRPPNDREAERGQEVEGNRLQSRVITQRCSERATLKAFTACKDGEMHRGWPRALLIAGDLGDAAARRRRLCLTRRATIGEQQHAGGLRPFGRGASCR